MSNPYRPERSRRLASPLTLDDLIADLVWPKLLKVGPLAIRPARLGLALVFLIGARLIIALSDWLDWRPGENVLGEFARTALALLRSLRPLEAHHAANELVMLMVGLPAQLLRDSWQTALISIPLLLIWTVIFGGAIARSAACDFCAGVSIPWPQALGFGLTRWRSLLGAVLLPLLLVWVIVLGMAAAGWALFSLPWLNVLGGVLWGLFLIGGLVCAGVSIAYALGHSLLVPSVAVEGTDAIDAVQHAYSFVFARPLRLVIYLVILAVQFLVVGTIVALMVWLLVQFAHDSASAWSGPRGKMVISGLPTPPPSSPPTDAPQSGSPIAGAPMPTRLAHGLVTTWTLVPILLGFSFAVSYYWSAMVVLYLAMRRITDGQDVQELWMPGMVEGTLARAAAPAGAASAPLPPFAAASATEPKSPPGKGEGVIDNGPADET